MSFNVYLIQNTDLNTDAPPLDFNMLDMDQMTEEKEYSESHPHIFARTGQQKLLLADLMAYPCYFGEFRKIPKYVVVAGAAPGNHFETLIKMLPAVTEWHLYDPRDFCPEVCNLRHKGFQCSTYQQFYTDVDCETWSEKEDVLFLCDIRDPRIGEAPELEGEQLVENDMNTQKEFVENTQAEMSVIKLRLTYPVKGGRYESEYACNYLLGTNYFQPFNRHNSTECRLTCVPLNVQSYRADKNPAIFEESTYNVSTHERKCAYLNTEKRPEWDYQAASKIYVNYLEMMNDIAERHVPMTVEQFVSLLSAGVADVENAIRGILDNELKKAGFT